MAAPTKQPGEESQDGSPDGVDLTPSDQLFSVFITNLILIAGVWASFEYGYRGHPPSLPLWVYWMEGVIVVGSGALALFDSWWPQLRHILTKVPAVRPSQEIPVVALKVTLFALTIANVVVLWKLADRTGGVISPYTTFLTAPAIFAPFIAIRWRTIGFLSAAVIAGLWLLIALHSPEARSPEHWVYAGVASLMIAIAAFVSSVRRQVESTGEPITGPNPTPPDLDPPEPGIPDAASVPGS